MKITAIDLRQRQSLPLESKVALAKSRIVEFYEAVEGNVAVSFSGGKDSTVLLHLVRSIYPEAKAVFADTGLEFPEIRTFVQSIENVDWVRPKVSFREVIEQHGYPMFSKKTAKALRVLQENKPCTAASQCLYRTGVKRDGSISQHFKLSQRVLPLADQQEIRFSERCCDFIKKQPLKDWQKANGMPGFYIGTMASDSRQRRAAYLETGCINLRASQCLPLAVWYSTDVWEYIRSRQIPYATIYDQGEERTGCVFCGFGAHMEKSPNRFERMRTSHPKLYRYCMETLGMDRALTVCGIAH